MPKFVEPLADTMFNRARRNGHLMRNGHELRAVQVSDTGELWETVYLCCGRVPERLEYLRSQIEAESISSGEIAELQELAPYIEPGDVQLLEWAGVPEHD